MEFHGYIHPEAKISVSDKLDSEDFVTINIIDYGGESTKRLLCLEDAEEFALQILSVVRTGKESKAWLINHIQNRLQGMDIQELTNIADDL